MDMRIYINLNYLMASLNDDSLLNFLKNYQPNEWNNLLKKYGLNAFQHRITIRLTNYIQKIFCCANSPSNLANFFIINSDLNKRIQSKKST